MSPIFRRNHQQIPELVDDKALFPDTHPSSDKTGQTYDDLKENFQDHIDGHARTETILPWFYGKVDNRGMKVITAVLPLQTKTKSLHVKLYHLQPLSNFDFEHILLRQMIFVKPSKGMLMKIRLLSL